MNAEQRSDFGELALAWIYAGTQKDDDRPAFNAMITFIDTMLAAATAAEREECAKVCEEAARNYTFGWKSAEDAANAIRARSKP